MRDEFTATVRLLGNSRAVIIPSQIAKKLGLRTNSVVKVGIELVAPYPNQINAKIAEAADGSYYLKIDQKDIKALVNGGIKVGEEVPVNLESRKPSKTSPVILEGKHFIISCARCWKVSRLIAKDFTKSESYDRKTGRYKCKSCKKSSKFAVVEIKR